MLRTYLVNKVAVPKVIRRMILAWLIAVLIEYSILPTELRSLDPLTGISQMSIYRVAGIAVALTLLFSMIRMEIVERWGIVIAFALLALLSLKSSATLPFYVTCVFILAALVVFALRGWNKSREVRPAPVKAHSAYQWATMAICILFFLFVSAWSVGRVYSFSTPSFDFGIFSQMYHYMKETGLPMTTLERDGLLSHFAVHVSPIYYILLPFYVIAPYPAALQVLQAVVLTSAVIPLWKIGKHHGLTGLQRMLLCGLLLLYPAYSGGVGYDFHENCFLTPLLLWLFYGIDRKKWWITGVAALLTLMVKEDAAVYVAVIALWLIVKSVLRFKRRDKQTLIAGIVLLAISLAWFLAVTGYLAQNGDGVMTYRYRNFMYDGSASLLTVIKSVILNPMKAIYECVDIDKIHFIGLTFVPLLGLPLFTRRYERYILLIPYILINLMSDYRYQHDIFFQYTFGSVAFLIYLTAVNLSEIKKDWKRVAALGTAFIVSVVFFAGTVVPKATSYPIRAIKHFDYYQDIRDILDTIPEDASVAAHTFYTVHLSQREIVYDIMYSSWEHISSVDYVVLNLSATEDYRNYASYGKNDGLENFIAALEQSGYQQYESFSNILVIYSRK